MKLFVASILPRMSRHRGTIELTSRMTSSLSLGTHSDSRLTLLLLLASTHDLARVCGSPKPSYPVMTGNDIRSELREVSEKQQLLADLRDSSHARLGWPIYWTKRGAYFFDDKTRRGKSGTLSFWNFPPHADVDYSFCSIADARRRIEGRLWEFNHLGETGDLPSFNAAELIDGASTPTKSIMLGMLDYKALDDPDAVVSLPHQGGISRPPEAVPHRDKRNGLSSQIRCMMTGIDISLCRPTMATQGIPRSPVKRWLVDTGSGYDPFKRKEITKLRSLFRTRMWTLFSIRPAAKLKEPRLCQCMWKLWMKSLSPIYYLQPQTY